MPLLSKHWSMCHCRVGCAVVANPNPTAHRAVAHIESTVSPRRRSAVKYVVTDRGHRSLADKFAAAKDFAELVYPSPSYAKSRDAPYLVFRIRTAPTGEP